MLGGESGRKHGHGDERGSREYNIGLGERRGQAVRRALLLQGVAEVQFGAFTFRADVLSAPLAPGVIATIGGERQAS